MTLVQDRQLRIALFSDSALPILNGVSVSIDTLVQGLRQRGHSVHIFTASHPGHQDADPNTYRFPALHTPWTPGYPLAVPPFFPMIRHFRRHQFDLIHCHTPYTLGFVGLRWAQSHDIPVVATYHTLYDKYAHYVPFFPKGYVRYKIAKHTNFFYNSVRQVIVPSDAALRWLKRHSVRTPMTVIPTGITTYPSPPRAEARAMLGIRPDQKVILYVGRIAREKNMITLLESVRLAFGLDPSLVLWLVGDGPMREECARRAREMGIGDRVRFVGFVPRVEVDLYFEAADLFLFCSVTETQGLVVAEAMAHGLPAVVVNGGGASAAVESGINGLTVRNDPEAICGSIVDVLAEDGPYAAMSQAARITARGMSQDAMIDRIVEVYRRAIPGFERTPAPHSTYTL